MEQQPFTAAQLECLTYVDFKIKDGTLDENLPPVDHHCKHHVYKSPEVDLGHLDTLPLELLHVVLVQLDLRTLNHFRRLNRRAVQVVASIPQYKDVATYVPNLLQAISAIETDRYITCDLLFAKFCNAECEQCGHFAEFLYILTCERVCYHCLTELERFRPLSFSAATRKFGIRHEILKTLPHMKSIPGTYSECQRKSRERLVLVDSLSARQAAIGFHGSKSAMEQYVSAVTAREFTRTQHEAITSSNPDNESLSSLAQRPLFESLLEIFGPDLARFMPIMRTPWFNKVARELDRGFYCIACKDEYDLESFACRRKFAMTSFVEHIKEYGEIRNGKHHTC